MDPSIPDLSLIIPCYNEASHLEASVAQLLEVLDTTRYSYDIVFVDDGSRDHTRDVIARICAQRPQCRCIFHERNQGRGAAVKTGFAATQGRVTGFVDIDLEVHPQYIPRLVNLILQHGYDVATGFRHYLLRQTRTLHRHLFSRSYQWLCRFLLGLGVQDSETGYKFFKRSSAGAVVPACESNGWFWDTEVMSRAVLANLKIGELPVLFLRRMDKPSTVRLIRDSWRSVVELYRLRAKVGLSLHDRSPIYWSVAGYDLMMKLLYGREYRQTYAAVAQLIPAGSSVVDVCAGTCRLYFDHLQARRCEYLALDCNGHFVMAARNRGVKARLFNLLTEELPAADYVVMGSSFCHFYRHETEILAKMLSAARCGVIISEPVRNLSTCSWHIVGGIANRFTNPGVGEFRYRFDLESFRSFAERHGAARFLHQPGQRNAVAVFIKNRADMRVAADWEESELRPDGNRSTSDSSPYGV